MRTSNNPVLSRRDVFSRGSYPGVATPSTETLDAMYGATPTITRRMTIDDVVVRTATLLGIVVVTGGGAWALRLSTGPAIIAALAGFVIAMLVTVRRTINPPLILTYAALEGVFLGAISRVFELAYPGIVVQAVVGTVATFAGILIAYKSGRIRVTPKFQKMVVGALFGLVGLMVVNLLASVFVSGGLGLRSGGPLAIVFSLVCIGVAALSFALDFDAIEKGIARGAPERESWLAAFGLLVTLVWLYLEILRLLSYLRER